uniref:RNA-directed DNA polymerase n=1 Tax=Strongyloides venezuelensis TaxID=75913 RepID=A0A0K0FFI6_STRVS
MNNIDVIHYNKIIEELLSSRTIGFPRQNWKNILKTDASEQALGATLIQQNPSCQEEKIIIGIMNERLKKTLRKRHSSLLEMKCICVALDTFSYLLKGSTVYIQTDHKLIKQIQENKTEDKKIYNGENSIIFAPVYEQRQEKEILIDNKDLLCNYIQNIEDKGENDKENKIDVKSDEIKISSTNNRGRPEGAKKRKPGRPKGSRKEQKLIKETEEKLDDIMNTLHEYSIEEIIEHQRNSEEITPKYIEDNKLTYLNNCLGKVEGDKFKPQIPESLAPKIVEIIHQQGHYGITKMLRHLHRKYFSKHFNKYVKLYAEKCEECILRNSFKRDKYERTLNIMYPNQIWSCDLTGKFKFKGKERTVLICVDSFSKFVMSKEVNEDPKDKDIIKAISGFIYLYSKPLIIIMDNAKYLNSEEAIKFFNLSQIKVVNVAPYTHGNRLAELYIKLIEQTFSKLNQKTFANLQFEDAFEIFMFKERDIKDIEQLNLNNNDYDISRCVKKIFNDQEEVYNAVYTSDLYRKLSRKDQAYKINQFKKNEPNSRKLLKVSWTDIRKISESQNPGGAVICFEKKIQLRNIKVKFFSQL